MNPDDIRALPDAELDRQIAEAIGLRVCECTNGGEEYLVGPRLYHAHCGKMSRAPEFSRSFDALLAVKARDGYDGPVAWLHPRLPSPMCNDAWDLEHAQWIGVWGWLNYDAIGWAIRGPRALAEACLVAAQTVKAEKEKEA